MCVLTGGRYDQQSDGLYIRNLTSADEGTYYCQAVVESSGMFREQSITLKLLGTPRRKMQDKETDGPNSKAG